jgi:hypothetical protein
MPVTLPAVGSLNWGDALNAAITGLSATIDAHSAILATQPVSAQDSADLLALNNTASFAPGSNCGVSFTAPSNGKVYVTVSGHMQQSTAPAFCYLSYEIRSGATVGSGTVFFAALTDYGIGIGGAVGVRICASRRKLISGLTAGTPYNIRTMHLCTGGTFDIFGREIAVEPAKAS